MTTTYHRISIVLLAIGFVGSGPLMFSGAFLSDLTFPFGLAFLTMLVLPVGLAGLVLGVIALVLERRARRTPPRDARATAPGPDHETAWRHGAGPHRPPSQARSARPA